MDRIPFERPISVWLDPKHRRSGTRRISDVYDGLAALHRYGLGDLRHEPPSRYLWLAADAALAQAKDKPTDENVALAHEALTMLAEAGGSLAGRPTGLPTPSPGALHGRRRRPVGDHP